MACGWSTRPSRTEPRPDHRSCRHSGTARRSRAIRSTGPDSSGRPRDPIRLTDLASLPNPSPDGRCHSGVASQSMNNQLEYKRYLATWEVTVVATLIRRRWAHLVRRPRCRSHRRRGRDSSTERDEHGARQSRRVGTVLAARRVGRLVEDRGARGRATPIARRGVGARPGRRCRRPDRSGGARQRGSHGGSGGSRLVDRDDHARRPARYPPDLDGAFGNARDRRNGPHDAELDRRQQLQPVLCGVRPTST